MPRIFAQVRKVNVIQQGGGDIPPGAAVMSDSVALIATVFLNETIDGQTDEALFALNLALTDQVSGQTENITVAVNGADLSDAISGQAESVTLVLKDGELAETLAAQSEDTTIVLSGADLQDAIAGQTEAVTIVASGVGVNDDTLGTQGDSRESTVTRWATTNSTAGTAPTNPTNAQGVNNGTTAGVKAGGLINGTSTLNLNIVQPLAGAPAGSSPVLNSYYSVTPGVGDTFAVSVSYRQQGQGTNTVLTLPATGNFLTVPQQTTLTNIDPTVNVVVTFTHAATPPALGGNIAVDAVGLVSTGVL